MGRGATPRTHASTSATPGPTSTGAGSAWSTCPATSTSPATCSRGSGRWPRCCSSWRRTTGGVRSPRSTPGPSPRSASSTCCSSVTRCDLDRGAAAAARVQDRFASLGCPWRRRVLVSGATGARPPRSARSTRSTRLGCGAARRRSPTPRSPVRLWVDRSFTIRGAGRWSPGTLAAGTLAVDDALLLRGRRVRVRGLQTCGRAGRRS